MEVVKVSRENKEKLLQIAGEIQAKEGKRITMDDVISFLIDYYEKNESKTKKLNLIEVIKKYQFEGDPIENIDIDKEVYKWSLLVILLDTSFLYALFNSKDPYNSRAIEILKDIEDSKYGRPIVTDYIVDELLTLIYVRLGKHVALKVLNGLSELLDNGLLLVFVNEELFKRAIGCFMKYNLSFTDCTSVELLLREKERYIASLDKGFDNVKEITRIF